MTIKKSTLTTFIAVLVTISQQAFATDLPETNDQAQIISEVQIDSIENSAIDNQAIGNPSLALNQEPSENKSSNSETSKKPLDNNKELKFWNKITKRNKSKNSNKTNANKTNNHNNRATSKHKKINKDGN